MFLSNGVLYIRFTHFETDSDTLQTESSGYIDTIDLETCEHTQLFDLNEDDNFSVVMVKMLLLCTLKPRNQ